MKVVVSVCVIMQLTVVNSRIVDDLPQPCKKSDPNIETCFLEALNKLKQYIPTGIREYKIPPLDPLEVDLMRVSEESNDLFAIEFIARKAKLSGLSQVNIDNLKVDAENLIVELDATFPRMLASMNFKFSGKVSSVPLEFQGFLAADTSNLKLNVSMQFERTNNHGIEYGVLKTFTPKLVIEKSHLEITTKNPQNQPLADLVAKFFHDNNRLVLDMLSSINAKMFGDALRPWLEQSLTRMPIQRILVE